MRDVQSGLSFFLLSLGQDLKYLWNELLYKIPIINQSLCLPELLFLALFGELFSCTWFNPLLQMQPCRGQGGKETFGCEQGVSLGQDCEANGGSFMPELEGMAHCCLEVCLPLIYSSSLLVEYGGQYAKVMKGAVSEPGQPVFELLALSLHSSCSR